MVETKRITVTVPKFIYLFLKNRSVPMSRYIRNVLIGEKRHRDYGNKHQNERYETDMEFRERKKAISARHRLAFRKMKGLMKYAR